jgi:hypothetical protein
MRYVVCVTIPWDCEPDCRAVLFSLDIERTFILTEGGGIVDLLIHIGFVVVKREKHDSYVLLHKQ